MNLTSLRAALVMLLMVALAACRGGDDLPAQPFGGTKKAAKSNTQKTTPTPDAGDPNADASLDGDAPSDADSDVDADNDATPDGAAGTDSDANGPCAVNNGGCAPQALCTLDTGNIVCTCMPGYAGDGNSCSAINNCLTNRGGCDDNATCASTGPGTNLCTCRQGYSGSGQSCHPIDNCDIENGGCDVNADCVTLGPGTSSCVCRMGYTGNGPNCIPINSCNTNHGGCNPNAACVVTGPGTNSCKCNNHYVGDGRSCVAVNNCDTLNGGCDVHATCVMTGPGTSVCMCAGKPCAPVNSCGTNNGGCDAHATCTSTGVGTNSCACDGPYMGDGKTCTAVNSCDTSNGGCDAHATCTSTGPGTNSCACNDPYTGDGTTCAPINSCNTNNGGCDAHATCTFTGPGTNSCACNSPFLGDGLTCVAAGCMVNNGGCDINATCTDVAGPSNTCACKPNFVGNGKACTAKPVTTVGFLSAGSWVSKTVGTVNVSVMHARGTKTTVAYTLSGKGKKANPNGSLAFLATDAWKTVSIAIDPTLLDGDTIVLTLGTPTPAGSATLGAITTHVVTVVASDYCTVHYPKFVATSSADTDGDGIPDDCDNSLAPAGRTSVYLKPVSAAATSEYGVALNLLAKNAIAPAPNNDPVDNTFIFDHSWSQGYATVGAWASAGPALTQWFAVAFSSPVTVNELRFVNFSNLRDVEWMRGIKDFNVYGSNTAALPPTVGGAAGADMRLLATLSAQSFWDRSWVSNGVTVGLPQILPITVPGSYQYYYLEILTAQAPDLTADYPGDLTGFRKIEFATYADGACPAGNGGCDVTATCVDGPEYKHTCTCPAGYAHGSTCVATTFDPRTVSGLLTWLVGDTLNASDGSAVASWPDSSSNGNTAVQNTTAAQPALRANGVNGWPSLHFSGGQSLSLPITALPTGDGPYTVVVVAAVNNNARNGLVCGGVSGGSTANCFRTTDTNEVAYALDEMWSGKDLKTPANAFIAGRPFIGISRYGSGTRQILVNGALKATDVPGADNVIPGNVKIGSTYADDFLTGDIAEILIYGSSLPDADRQKIECYLGTRYAITLSHTCP